MKTYTNKLYENTKFFTHILHKDGGKQPTWARFDED